jgi:GntR family transcriptional regulator
MVPIYEQIVDQIKAAIVVGDIKPGDLLPSVRQQSKDLRISALTAKKAYDALEEEGFVTTVHGKGTFVSETNKDRIYEEQVRDVEKDMAKAVLKARQSGIKDDDIRSIFDMIMEDK